MPSPVLGPNVPENGHPRGGVNEAMEWCGAVRGGSPPVWPDDSRIMESSLLIGVGEDAAIVAGKIAAAR